MSWPLGIAIYFVLWWTILFAVLPWGVRTQAEDGSVVPGTPESAPTRPFMLQKVLWTTIVSAVIYAAAYAAFALGWLRLG